MSKLKRRLAGVGTGLLAGYLLGKSGFGSKPAKGATKKTITSKSKIVKDPTTEGLRITRSKPFEAEDTADPTATGLRITRSRPFEAEDVAMPRTPVGFEYEQGIEGTFGPMAKKGKFIVKKAKIGLFGRVPKQVADDKDRLTNTDIEDMIAAGNFAGTISPYLKKRDRDRLNKDIEEAQKNFYKKRNKDLTATEGSFMRGGSVVARGDKFSRNRSRPTKLS